MLARVTQTPPLPKRLADAIAHSARPGHSDDATKAAEQLVRARNAGNSKAAYKAAIKAKLAAPRSAWVREQLGLLAMELEHFHEAAQELLTYRRFTGDHRHDPTIADAYRREGKPARALDLLNELKPAHVSARTWNQAQIARARALAETGRKDAAITLLKAAARDAKEKRPMIEALADLMR
jgi:tetratricopeptide (TPR) repeat protein